MTSRTHHAVVITVPQQRRTVHAGRTVDVDDERLCAKDGATDLLYVTTQRRLVNGWVNFVRAALSCTCNNAHFTTANAELM